MEQTSTEESRCRASKPGRKRLAITLSVFFSFVIGLPFWLRSVEIYRTHLPFEDISSLGISAQSQPLTLPCHFNLILLENYIQSIDDSEPKHSLERLKHDVLKEVQSRIGKGNEEYVYDHGGCGEDFALTVTLDHNAECFRAGNISASLLWPCGLSNHIPKAQFREEDELIDELLQQYSSNDAKFRGGQYTILFSGAATNSKKRSHRAIIGKYRHAWIKGGTLDSTAVSLIGEVIVTYFMNGGRVPSGQGIGFASTQEKGEMMPLAADGSAVLSFSLLNADPDSWIYGWDFERLEKRFLSPLLEMLSPIATLSVESQILYHTPKAAHSYWDGESSSHVFQIKDLPFFVNSNEWHLDTSIAAAGRSKILQFAIYIPSAAESPLQLKLPDGQISTTNGFTSPGWGGVVVFNPSGHLQKDGYKKLVLHDFSDDDFGQVMRVIVSQLRTLLGLPSITPYDPEIGLSSIMSHQTGFSVWELDVLLRRRAAANVASCSLTLESLAHLVQSLPSMVIKDEIGDQVRQSIHAANMALKNSVIGNYYDVAEYAQKARAWAEAAFFQPSIMSLLYFPIEHHFAIYTPFFVPVLLHTLLAAVKEVTRYRKEQKKFLNSKLT